MQRRSNCIAEKLEPRRLLAFSASINFQPAGTPVPAGCFADTGAVYASRGNGFTYGWNQSAVGFARDRNSSTSPDQRYDTFIHTQLYGTRTWEIAVPNGQYTVHLVAGDPSYFDSKIAFDAEGVLVVSGTPTSSNHFLQGTQTVSVSDGKLTITNAPGAVNNKLSFIDIASASTVTTGTWPTSWTLGPVNTRQRWESAAVTMDGKIWDFNGWFSSSINGTHDYAVYDPAKNTWTDLGQDPIPVTHSLPAADPAHHVIYFLGGLDGDYPGVPTNKVWKYNTLNNTWSDMPAMPGVHSSGGVAFINNQLHYFGGVLEDHDVDVGDHIYLDLGNLAAGWQTAASMPVPLDHFATAVVGGKIYCLGGEFGHDKLHLQHTEVQIYDPATNKWTLGANAPIARSHTEAATIVTSDGKIIVAGGQTPNFTETDEVAEYDPIANSWSVIGKLPRALEGPVVQQLGNLIIVSGGNPGGGPINTTWIGRLS